jgi:ketosteroid isomerase-like protein
MNDNIETLRRGYESFSRGDMSATLELFADDIEWNEPEWTYGTPTGTFRGKQEVLRLWEQIPETNDSFSLEPREFLGEGDTVVVTGVFRVSPKGSGRTAEVPFAHVWRLSNGKAVSHHGYVDVREIYALSRELKRAA